MLEKPQNNEEVEGLDCPAVPVEDCEEINKQGLEKEADGQGFTPLESAGRYLQLLKGQVEEKLGKQFSDDLDGAINDFISAIQAKWSEKCIRCATPLSHQDMRGWEQLNSECLAPSKEDVWLCPNCIYDSTACHDKLRDVLRRISLKIEEELVVG